MSGPIGSGFAIYPFGTGAPATMATPPVVPTLTALFLDPVSRDHIVAVDSELERMPALRQQVLIALTTVIGSMSANISFGITMPQKIDEDFARKMRNSVETAVKHLTGPKLMKLLDVQTDTSTAMGRAITTVSFIDLTTNLPDQVSI
jgi:phage baseplate assembly protein W